MMNVQLTQNELVTVIEAIDKRIDSLQAEVAGTESHAIQRAIAKDIDALATVRTRLRQSATERFASID